VIECDSRVQQTTITNGVTTRGKGGVKMTDLEAHVAQPGRDDLVRQVQEKIDELGISYIYYQFMINL